MMDWSNDSLDEIIKHLPNRIKNYAEYKAEQMKKAGSNTPDLLDTGPKTLTEIGEEVNSAIDYVKTQIDDLELFDVLNVLHDKWDAVKDSFLIMSVMLVSLKQHDAKTLKVILQQGLRYKK